MQAEWSTSDLAFQVEVRAFITERLTLELADAGRCTTSVFSPPDATRRWQAILHEQGWVAPAWPREFGGPGWSLLQAHIFELECARAGAPILPFMGLRMCGPVLMRYGTPEQQRYFLPRILPGEDYWCQGYSEPEAGSDLANLKTRAVAEGDDYIVTGVKLWTTYAQAANRMFCLVRTAQGGKPQQGISFLLVDMDLPGVSVRPVITMAGDHEVNEVVLEQVRVPRKRLVGQENDGWTVAKCLLEFERGGGFAAGLRASFERLQTALRCDGTQGALADPGFQARLIEFETRLMALEVTEYRSMAPTVEGGSLGAASSTLKLMGSELQQDLDSLTLLAAGGIDAARASLGQPPDDHVIRPQSLATARYLNNRAASIYGGTNEVQRNIVARLILGL